MTAMLPGGSHGITDQRSAETVPPELWQYRQAVAFPQAIVAKRIEPHSATGDIADHAKHMQRGWILVVLVPVVRVEQVLLHDEDLPPDGVMHLGLSRVRDDPAHQVNGCRRGGGCDARRCQWIAPAQSLPNRPGSGRTRRGHSKSRGPARRDRERPGDRRTPYKWRPAVAGRPSACLAPDAAERRMDRPRYLSPVGTRPPSARDPRPCRGSRRSKPGPIRRPRLPAPR